MDKGAHFHRTDLQVHTPRDRAWSGPDPVSDADRKAYARSLVQACRNKELNAIAVTDHHDLMFVRYIRDAAKDERDESGNMLPPEKQLVVFPGIELTLNVPCQAIIVFDADFPDDLFSLALTALTIAPSADDDAKTTQTKRLDHITTLEGLHNELDKHKYLRRRYIILPNVSDGGSDTLLRKGNNGKYASMPCVGGYLDGPYDNLGAGNRKICDGKAAEWGHKRVALFQTSDSRTATHKKLGTHSTWVKWAVPTAEALRQACLAQESRIAQDPPELPSVGVTSLSVSGSAFLGPINIEFNPQYNALIGGRGTGKSTILEYLRWALCDQIPDLAGDEELPNYQVRRGSLIEKTLRAQKATVEVGFTVNGISHVVRRNSENGSLTLKVGTGEYTECRESEVRALLPIQAYSQKQLSNVSVRLEELSRFIEAPVRSELDELAARFERNTVESRQVYATVIRKRQLEKQLRNDELQLQSLLGQVESIRKALVGLSDGDRAILDKKSLYDQAEETVSRFLGDVEQIHDAARELAFVLDGLPTKPEIALKDLPEGDLLTELQSYVVSFVEDAKKVSASLNQVSKRATSGDGEIRGDLKKLRDAWHKRQSEYDSSYESAKERASVHQSRLQELGQLEKRCALLRKGIAKTKKEITSLAKPEQRFAALRTEWSDLHVERSRKLETECANLTKRSKGEIRASLVEGGESSRLVEQLRQALTGSGLRRDKLEKLGAHFADSTHPIEAWLEVLGELEGLAVHDADNGDKNIPKCPVLTAAGLSAQDIEKVASHLEEETWLQIALLTFRDRPFFEFRVREEDYIPFENASAGQQATALLKALLNQPGPPLIIDQPEEDLDNPVILDVVEQIWNAKKVRQLVFASHNANLVVNGDSELVIWCDHRKAGDHSRGEVAGQGAIDIPTICNAIKRVMEGGEDAFNLRRAKYGF